MELRQKKRNPHSDELAEKGGDAFSFVLEGSEFPLHVLQISQEWGEKLLLRGLHLLNYPQPTPLVAEQLCASQTLRQACGKGPVGRFTEGGKPEGDGLALYFFSHSCF